MIGLGVSRHASFNKHVSEICMSRVRGVVDAGIWRRRRLSWRRWCSSWRGGWQLQPPRARKLPETMQQLQEDFKASHTDRCAALTSAKTFLRPDQTRTTW